MLKRLMYWIGGIIASFLAVIVGVAAIAPAQPTPIETTMVATSTAEAAATTTAALDAQPDPETESVPSGMEYHSVTKVVDGDTLTVNIDGKAETIRLIGIDTPETVDPRKTVQCFGKEASDKAKLLLVGKKVRIEKDASQGDRDKYQRLLAYVYLEDGTFFNKYMIENGYAHEYTYDLPYKHQSEFKAAQASAQAAKKGLWSPTTCNGTTTSAPKPTSASTPTPQPATSPAPSTSGFSCSANIYNCDDFSGHTQAQAVYEQCGGVNNDVHGLDRDKDGLACE